MKVDRLLTWAAVVALASALAACADEDRPPASESAPISSVQLGGSADVAASDDDAGTDVTAGPCEPRSHRDCKMYYRDESGELHCPTSFQLCDVDGTEWLPCGAYTLDENGDPQPVH